MIVPQMWDKLAACPTISFHLWLMVLGHGANSIYPP
jgi:hypothetical protein